MLLMKKSKFLLKKKYIYNKDEVKVKHKHKYKYILISLLIIILIITNLFNKKTNIQKKIESIELPENKDKDIFNSSKIPLNEHYKYLLPKKKSHPPHKQVKLEDVFKSEDSYDFKKMKETGKDKYIYHTCVIAQAKYENLYIRDFVEYYMSIGVEKFYFGDDNPDDVENLGDVLSDFIQRGIVEIEYINHLKVPHHIFVEHAFDVLKFRCKWFIIYSIDEFLVFRDKNMTIKAYLDMPVFDKCDSVKVHWLIHDDNNLLYYDNRPLLERFNHSLWHHPLNVYHKSIVRGKDYGGLIFPHTGHQPDEELVKDQCDALGNFERISFGTLGRAKFDLNWISHFSRKTAEEFAIKLLRGQFGNTKFDYDSKLKDFTEVNEITEEKIKVIENIINYTFTKFHQKEY